MKPLLCKAGQQLREQIDDSFPDRDRKSDGWIGDSKHASRGNKSDHNPDFSNKNSQWAYVRAIDVDKDLDSRSDTGAYLADQIRECAKKDRRISYIIYSGKIASRRTFFRWVKYKGINSHHAHIHISFSKEGDQNGRWFDIPMLGAIQ
jgi:hypothetical protein